jgi:thioredoxin-related protein
MVEYVGWKDPIGEGLYNMGVTDERIIRCRDCKHATMTVNDECKYCEKLIKWTDGEVDVQPYFDGGFFCGFGEPREKEQA